VAMRRHADRYVDSDTWLRSALRRDGSWWLEWTEWLERRSAAERIAAPATGAPARGFVPLGPAPGEYVHQH